MQIQVKCTCGAENCPEWAIVELQGVVEVQPAFEDKIQNLEIGRLCRPSDDDKYTLTIGYHELSGTKVALKKPLAVLKKVKPIEIGKVELDVVGIIRSKILFKTRPKALISKTEPVVKDRVKTAASSSVM
ncbi:Chromosome transmission fidelity protein 8 homolog [Linum perenne]